MSELNFQNRTSGRKRKWVGIALLFFGGVMLLKTVGFFIPNWVLSWPVALIAFGVYTGQRHQFRNPSSFILIVIGAVALAGKIVPKISFGNFVWPIAIIGVGLYFIIGKKKITNWGGGSDNPPRDLNWDKRVDEENRPVSATSSEDYFDIVSIFGGVKKNVVSKNFLGGEITAIMGGAEIILTQADIASPRVELDITQIFGGTKIIVPPHWKISSDLVAIFGGIEDKRPVLSNQMFSDEKILFIKGTSIFGGIDIRSF